MKYFLIIPIALITLLSFSKPIGDTIKNNILQKRMAMIADMTPEQMANLMTKRMTFKLDLTQDQITKIKPVHLELAKEAKEKMKMMKAAKEAGKKLDSKKMYEMMNARLDKLIETKQTMKNILSKEQLEEWEVLQSQRTKFVLGTFDGKH